MCKLVQLMLIIDLFVDDLISSESEDEDTRSEPKKDILG